MRKKLRKGKASRIRNMKTIASTNIKLPMKAQKFVISDVSGVIIIPPNNLPKKIVTKRNAIASNLAIVSSVINC